MNEPYKFFQSLSLLGIIVQIYLCIVGAVLPKRFMEDVSYGFLGQTTLI